MCDKKTSDLVHVNDSVNGVASLRPQSSELSGKSLNGIAGLRPSSSETPKASDSGKE